MCCPPEASEEDKRKYLRDLADEADCQPYQILEDPLTHLEPWLHASYEVRPRPLPTRDDLTRYRRDLWRSKRRLAQLQRERGLTFATIHEHGVGWDETRQGYVLPIEDESGTLVNVSRRAPKGRVLRLPSGEARDVDRIGGRTAEDGCLPLYPMPPPRSRWWLLCEGEWDALLARQEGLPAITGLLGKQWNSAWDRYVVRRHIAVAYDVGAEREAESTARLLETAGARPWIVNLGLPEEGDDVGDWFLKYGRSADELLALCRRARRRR